MLSPPAPDPGIRIRNTDQNFTVPVYWTEWLMQVAETYSGAEYARSNPIPRSQLFNARLELELEKQVAALQLIEVNLRMDPAQVPYSENLIS